MQVVSIDAWCITNREPIPGSKLSLKKDADELHLEILVGHRPETNLR